MFDRPLTVELHNSARLGLTYLLLSLRICTILNLYTDQDGQPIYSHLIPCILMYVCRENYRYCVLLCILELTKPKMPATSLTASLINLILMQRLHSVEVYNGRLWTYSRQSKTLRGNSGNEETPITSCKCVFMYPSPTWVVLLSKRSLP